MPRRTRNPASVVFGVRPDPLPIRRRQWLPRPIDVGGQMKRIGGQWAATEPDRKWTMQFRCEDTKGNFGKWLPRFPGDLQGGCWMGPVVSDLPLLDACTDEEFLLTRQGRYGMRRDGQKMGCYRTGDSFGQVPLFAIGNEVIGFDFGKPFRVDYRWKPIT